MRLLRGELRKLIKRPASRITLILQLAIIARHLLLRRQRSFKAIATDSTAPNAEQSRAGIKLLLTFPGAYAGVIGLITGLGGLLAIGYGASAAGADWGWGMVEVAIARGESRSRYILAKLVAVAAARRTGRSHLLRRRRRGRDHRLGDRRHRPVAACRTRASSARCRNSSLRGSGHRRGGHDRICRSRRSPAQPAGRPRGRDRALFRRAVLDPVPARHRPLPAVPCRLVGPAGHGRSRRRERRRRRPHRTARSERRAPPRRPCISSSRPPPADV